MFFLLKSKTFIKTCLSVGHSKLTFSSRCGTLPVYNFFFNFHKNFLDYTFWYISPCCEFLLGGLYYSSDILSLSSNFFIFSLIHLLLSSVKVSFFSLFFFRLNLLCCFSFGLLPVHIYFLKISNYCLSPMTSF